MLRWAVVAAVPVCAGAAAATVLGSDAPKTLPKSSGLTGPVVSQCEAATPMPEALSTGPTDLVLQQVQVLFRHGARAPLTGKFWPELGYQWDVCGCYAPLAPIQLQAIPDGPPPTSEWNESEVATKLPGGCSKGELTMAGQKQALEFGHRLRRRYVEQLGLLPPQYEPAVLSNRTTNFSRTIATMGGVLTGLYPQPGQPMAVSTCHELDEVMYVNERSCTRLGEVMKAHVHQLRVAAAPAGELDNAYHAILEAAVAATGKALPPGGYAAEAAARGWRGRMDAVHLYDVLSCAAFHGKPMPAGVTPELMLKLNQRATLDILHRFAPQASTGTVHQEVMRLGIGVVLEMLVANMEKRVAAAGTDPAATAKLPRMHLYSAHDDTLMPVLVALGQVVDTWPLYLSNVTLELWEGTPPPPAAAASAQGQATQAPLQRQHYVRVLYNEEEISIPGSTPGVPVELDAFKSVVLPYRIPEEVRKQQCTVMYTHEDSEAHAVDAQTGKRVQGM